MAKQTNDLSVVIPMFNEEKAAGELHKGLVKSLTALKKGFEIIFVNDGSTDSTLKRLIEIKKRDRRVKVINLMGNFGQTAALSAGFDYASGDVIITMDGDLQDDPDDIRLLIDKLDEGYDIVSGWRKDRKENLFLRRIPSIVANRLLAMISGVHIHDFGAPLKAYRREVIKNIKLYGDFHRFIPALAKNIRARVTEVPVKNYRRPYGTSKYGLKRTITVFFDLFRLKFLLSYINKPLQIFGTIGIFLIIFGSIFFVYVFVDKLVFGVHIMVEHGPMFITSIFLIISGINLFTTGMLGELMLTNLYKSKEKKSYYIREIYE